MTGRPRLVLLATSGRVAPGLLPWPVWQTLRDADVVLAGDPRHPLLGPFADAGIAVTLVAEQGASPTHRLLEEAGSGCAVWLLSPDSGARSVAELTAELRQQTSGADRGSVPTVELLTGSWDLPGARLLDAVAVMDRLRSPGGCPWDARQTHESLVEYLLEEAYETVEAIETADRPGLREELGDLLLQVLFHARIAAEDEADPWTIDDVAAGLAGKLVARHPHVFAGASADTPEQVEASWHALKQAEKGRESATDGIPLALPALVLAGKLLGRAARAGVDVPPPELSVPGPVDPDALGELLLALVAYARGNDWDAEATLRSAVRRHRSAIRVAEGLPG